MSKKKEKVPGFEDAMQELEGLVNSMEKDSLTLAESLQAFEKGVKLTRICQQALSSAEQEVKVLTKDGEMDFDSNA